MTRPRQPDSDSAATAAEALRESLLARAEQDRGDTEVWAARTAVARLDAEDAVERGRTPVSRYDRSLAHGVLSGRPEAWDRLAGDREPTAHHPRQVTAEAKQAAATRLETALTEEGRRDPASPRVSAARDAARELDERDVRRDLRQASHGVAGGQDWGRWADQYVSHADLAAQRDDVARAARDIAEGRRVDHPGGPVDWGKPTAPLKEEDTVASTDTEKGWTRWEGEPPNTPAADGTPPWVMAPTTNADDVRSFFDQQGTTAAERHHTAPWDADRAAGDRAAQAGAIGWNHDAREPYVAMTRGDHEQPAHAARDQDGNEAANREADRSAQRASAASRGGDTGWSPSYMRDTAQDTDRSVRDAGVAAAVARAREAAKPAERDSGATPASHADNDRDREMA